MSRFYPMISFIKHRFKSGRWDYFHSPYLYKLFSTCCDETIDSPIFKKIESERRRLRQLNERVKRTDYGSGIYRAASNQNVKLSAIAKHSLSMPFQCRFLYRLMKLLNPQLVFEFGTCLGISSSYLGSGTDHGEVITIEGDPILASISKKVFQQLSLKNIRSITSTFEDFIQDDLPHEGAVDFIFLDGNHNSKALLKYYTAVKTHLSGQSIVMVDDIYWSADMHSGWNSLIQMPEVTQSVDCFHFGLLFFSNDFLSRQNHIIHLP